MSQLASTGPADDWPPAVQILNEAGASGIVLICEHASNHIPVEYDGLGLSPAELDRHIAWDLNAAALTRRLSELLDAPAFLGSYSRLLIDLNRPLHVPSSSVVRSEDTDIPGNHALDAAERRRRAERIFHPFHDCVRRHLDARHQRATRLVCVHTFTPVFQGTARPWHAGVLYDAIFARQFGERVLARLGDFPDLVAGANVPYRVTRDDDYALYAHGADRGLDAIIIEIRQDLLEGDDAVALWAERVAHATAAPETPLRSVG